MSSRSSRDQDLFVIGIAFMIVYGVLYSFLSMTPLPLWHISVVLFLSYGFIIKSSTSNLNHTTTSDKSNNKVIIDGSRKELEILQAKYKHEEKMWLQTFVDLEEKSYKHEQDWKKLKCQYNEDSEMWTKDYKQLKAKYNKESQAWEQDREKLRAEYDEKFEAWKKELLASYSGEFQRCEHMCVELIDKCKNIHKEMEILQVRYKHEEMMWLQTIEDLKENSYKDDQDLKELKCKYNEDLETWKKDYERLKAKNNEESQAWEQDQEKLRARYNEEFETLKKELIARYDDEIHRWEHKYKELIAKSENRNEEWEKLSETCKYDSELLAKLRSIFLEKANANNEENEVKLDKLKAGLGKVEAEYKNIILDREMWTKEKSKIVAEHEEEKSKIVTEYEEILMKKKLKYKEDRREWSRERTNLVAELSVSSRSAELYRVLLHEFDKFSGKGSE